MENLRRVAIGVFILLAANLLSLWIIEGHRTVDHRLIEYEIKSWQAYCDREFYRLRADDMNDLRNRLKTVEYVLGVRPQPTPEPGDDEATRQRLETP